MFGESELYAFSSNVVKLSPEFSKAQNVSLMLLKLLKPIKEPSKHFTEWLMVRVLNRTFLVRRLSFKDTLAARFFKVWEDLIKSNLKYCGITLWRMLKF